MYLQRPKLGVALGAGGGKGWAHIGVLKVLQREKIPLKAIAGTSAGALIAAFYAAGKLPRLEEFLLTLDDWKKSLRFFDFVYPKKGIIKGERIVSLVDDLMGDMEFSDLCCPLYIVAVDIISGQEVVFHQQDLKTAIRASISLPGVMNPVRYKGMLLVDGGLLNPLPVEILNQRGIDKTVAVDLSGLLLRKKGRSYKRGVAGYIYQKEKQRGRRSDAFNQKSITELIESGIVTPQEGRQKRDPGLGLYDILMRSFTITQNRMNELLVRESKPDLILSPDINFGMLELYRAYEAMEAGEKITLDNLSKIRHLLRRWA